MQFAHVIGKLEWALEYSDGSYPYNAVSVGRTEGDVVFVCRAHIENNLIPGKLHPRWNACSFAYSKTELGSTVYDVAVGVGSWVGSNGDVPNRSLRCGYENGETLYCCRGLIKDGIYHTGKFKPSQRTCYISYGKKEYTLSSFSVLVD